MRTIRIIGLATALVAVCPLGLVTAADVQCVLLLICPAPCASTTSVDVSITHGSGASTVALKLESGAQRLANVPSGVGDPVCLRDGGCRICVFPSSGFWGDVACGSLLASCQDV